MATCGPMPVERSSMPGIWRRVFGGGRPTVDLIGKKRHTVRMNASTPIALLVVAGGRGSRAGEGLPHPPRHHARRRRGAGGRLQRGGDGIGRGAAALEQLGLGSGQLDHHFGGGCRQKLVADLQQRQVAAGAGEVHADAFDQQVMRALVGSKAGVL